MIAILNVTDQSEDGQASCKRHLLETDAEKINRLLYQAYGLNEDDIREVKTGMLAAQRANLERKLAAEREEAGQ